MSVLASGRLATIGGAIGLALMTAPAMAQEVRIVDAGPRNAARALAQVLAEPHTLIVTGDSLVELPRDSVYDRSIVFVGARRVTVASTVRGSVVVIGGDLFLHPGVALSGDAVTYGGGVYDTRLGTRRSIIANRDFTFDLAGEPGAYTLRYRAVNVEPVPTVDLGMFSGFRVPAYDRVNGLSLVWGPRINLGPQAPAGPTRANQGRYVIDATMTYRSDLGDMDPRIATTANIGRYRRLTLTGARTTLTNEDWIRGPFINSIGSLFGGSDVRNYRRADRGDLVYQHDRELSTGYLTYEVGGAVERAWSVGPERGTTSNVWSVLNRTDTLDGMLRANPAVLEGRISSALAGLSIDGWRMDDVTFDVALGVEASLETPDDSRFTQGTLDLRVLFPTFRNHTFRFEVHAMATAGDTPPPQRFSYMGGSGTLPTVDLLTMGGDQVVFLESRYMIPIEAIALPVLGSPTVSLRHMMGAAGVDRLPGFVNNVGVRVAMSLVKADFTIDPESGDTKISVGLSFGR